MPFLWAMTMYAGGRRNPFTWQRVGPCGCEGTEASRRGRLPPRTHRASVVPCAWAELCGSRRRLLLCRHQVGARRTICGGGGSGWGGWITVGLRVHWILEVLLVKRPWRTTIALQIYVLKSLFDRTSISFLFLSFHHLHVLIVSWKLWMKNNQLYCPGLNVLQLLGKVSAQQWKDRVTSSVNLNQGHLMHAELPAHLVCILIALHIWWSQE
jgi:hypothetical protein